MRNCFRCKKSSEPKEWDWDDTFSIWTHVAFTMIGIQLIAVTIMAPSVLVVWLNLFNVIGICFVVLGIIVYLSSLPLGFFLRMGIL